MLDGALYYFYMVNVHALNNLAYQIYLVVRVHIKNKSFKVFPEQCYQAKENRKITIELEGWGGGGGRRLEFSRYDEIKIKIKFV